MTIQSAKYQIFKIDQWSRKEHFEIFKQVAQNAFSLTVEIEITDFLNEVKRKDYKFYPVMIHKVASILNQYSEFKMALKDGELVVYDEVHPSYTTFHAEVESFSALWSEYRASIDDFLLEYEQDIQKYGGDLSYFPKGDLPENIFYISALPWVSFTSFSMQFASLENLFTPIVTLGKYFSRDNKIFIPVAIQLHHAVCDGFHAGRFFNDLQQSCQGTTIPTLDKKEAR